MKPMSCSARGLLVDNVRLRHAFATLQLEAGDDVFEVNRALGHASIATTANTYGHFMRAMAARSADRMTAILDESTGG